MSSFFYTLIFVRITSEIIVVLFPINDIIRYQKKGEMKMYHKIYESAIRQIDNGTMTKTEAIEWIRKGYHSEQNKKKAIRLIEIHYLGKEI